MHEIKPRGAGHKPCGTQIKTKLNTYIQNRRIYDNYVFRNENQCRPLWLLLFGEEFAAVAILVLRHNCRRG